MLCHIQKHTKIHMYSARDKKETWLVIWWYYGRWLAFVPCACAYVYVVCMSVRRGCCCHILDVDSTVQQWQKTEYCYQTVPRTPEIFTSLLHICDLRSRTTIEKLFSIEVPPCITAIETSHKQKKDVKWPDKQFSFDSLPISSWKPESRQTSHNIFWYKSPGNTSLRRNNLNKIRGCH